MAGKSLARDMAYEHPNELWYRQVDLEVLLGDLDTLLRGSSPGNVIRVRTDASAAWDRFPAWCAERGYRLVRRSDDWEGVREGEPGYRTGRYLFEIARE